MDGLSLFAALLTHMRTLQRREEPVSMRKRDELDDGKLADVVMTL